MTFAALETSTGTWLSDGQEAWLLPQEHDRAAHALRDFRDPVILDLNPEIADFSPTWRSLLVWHRALHLGEARGPMSGNELIDRHLLSLPQQAWIVGPDDPRAHGLHGQQAIAQVTALAKAAAALHQTLSARTRPDLLAQLVDNEFPVHAVHQRITRTGVHLSADRLARLWEDGPKLVHRLTQMLAAEGLNNPLDVVCVADWAFEKFKARIATDDSNDADDDLKVLAVQHPACALLRRLRKMVGLLDQPWLHGPNHVHPTHHTLAATTGRTKSTNPSVGGAPKEFRPVVIPAPGLLMGESDYASMDLCTLATLAKDRDLAELCETGFAIAHLAKLIFPELADVPVENVKAACKPKYNATKAIAYGVIYGRTAQGLADAIGVRDQRAQRLIDRLLNPFPRVLTWRKAIVESVFFNNGLVPITPAMSRQLTSEERKHGGVAARRALNTPIQGLGAVVFRKATILAELNLKGIGGQIVLPNHDSLLWQAPPEHMSDAEAAVATAMQQAAADVLGGFVRPVVACERRDPSCWNDGGSSSSFDKALEIQK